MLGSARGGSHRHTVSTITRVSSASFRDPLTRFDAVHGRYVVPRLSGLAVFDESPRWAIQRTGKALRIAGRQAVETSHATGNVRSTPAISSSPRS